MIQTNQINNKDCIPNSFVQNQYSPPALPCRVPRRIFWINSQRIHHHFHTFTSPFLARTKCKHHNKQMKDRLSYFWFAFCIFDSSYLSSPIQTSIDVCRRIWIPHSNCLVINRPTFNNAKTNSTWQLESAIVVDQQGSSFSPKRSFSWKEITNYLWRFFQRFQLSPHETTNFL